MSSVFTQIRGKVRDTEASGTDGCSIYMSKEDIKRLAAEFAAMGLSQDNRDHDKMSRIYDSLKQSQNIGRLFGMPLIVADGPIRVMKEVP